MIARLLLLMTSPFSLCGSWAGIVKFKLSASHTANKLLGMRLDPFNIDYCFYRKYCYSKVPAYYNESSFVSRQSGKYFIPTYIVLE